jgi:septal ring factor EnvC (AmiA/AmiB activator)
MIKDWWKIILAVIVIFTLFIAIYSSLSLNNSRKKEKQSLTTIKEQEKIIKSLDGEIKKLRIEISKNNIEIIKEEKKGVELGENIKDEKTKKNQEVAIIPFLSRDSNLILFTKLAETYQSR